MISLFYTDPGTIDTSVVWSRIDVQRPERHTLFLFI